MGNLNDLYPNSLYGENYKEYVINKINKKSTLDEKSKNNHKNDNIKTEEYNELDEIQIELDNIKSLLNQLLRNQESILNGIDDIKNSKKLEEERSSFVAKIFKGN